MCPPPPRPRRRFEKVATEALAAGVRVRGWVRVAVGRARAGLESLGLPGEGQQDAVL